MEKKRFFTNLSELKKTNTQTNTISIKTNTNLQTLNYTNTKQTESELEIEILYSDHIKSETIESVLQSKKFIEYLSKLDLKSLLLRSIKILSVYMFGKNVGFIGLEADCSLKTHPETKLPGYAFVRGKSVAIFVLINNKFMVLTKQFRVPVGKFMLEIPAGMLDESGDFCGSAAKELEEEIGMKINAKDLIYLTSMYPSCGGSDEEIIFYFINLTLEDKQIEDLRSKTFGDEKECEIITLQVLELSFENILETKDAKLFTAAFASETKLGVKIPKKGN